MPTGYTAGIEDGTITEFRDFALDCARAFGALVHMRDDDSTAEIRPRTMSDYSEKALADARARLDESKLWTDEQAQERADEADRQAWDQFNKSQTRALVERKRYADMLAKVGAWTPPTKDHLGLRDFMIQQIEESQKYSYTPDVPKKLSGVEYRRKCIERAERDIAYHAKAIAEEQERIDKSNAWIEALKKSLP